MINIIKKLSLRLAMLGLALSFITGSALADKPEWAERGKHRDIQEQRKHHKQDYRGHNTHRRSAADYRFRNSDRRLISSYYRDEQRRGKCPRGLAKKNNRCQPPGQYKKWHRGQPLTKHTRYYDLPRGLHSRLAAPPDNHRYVRVNDNILLIDSVTNLVVDVMQNILR